MIDRETAVAAAAEWLDAWNAHNPERVVAHFADDVVIFSPVDVCTGVDGFTVVYRNERGTLVTEQLTVGDGGLASVVRVSYGA
jgi:ketosteroid isomerase-like protein